MSPLLSRISDKYGIIFSVGESAREISPFQMILANTSSNNIIKYDSTTDTFSSVTVGSAGQVAHLHNTSGGLVAITTNDSTGCAVFRSTNNGSSWTQISTIGFSSSAVNYSKYASKSGQTIIVTQGVYQPPARRSTDGGLTWSGDITVPDQGVASALSSASLSNGAWYITGRKQGGFDIGAIWRSTNSGASWTKVFDGNNDMTQGKVTYMSNVSRYLAANYAYSTYTYQKPVYSSNGTSWTNPGNGNDTSNRIDTDVDASPTSCIGVRNNTSIFRSTDGLNWSSIDLSYLSGLDTHKSVTYDSTLGTYFVLGQSYFLYSIDDGLTWTKKSTIISGNYSNIAPLILPS